MRYLIGLLLLLLAAGLVWALLPGEEVSALRQVVVYSPHGEDLLRDFKQRFESAYPGLELVFQALPGQEVKSRIRAEARRPRADLWWGGAITDFLQLEAEGLLQPYRPQWAEHVPAALRSPTHSFYAQWLTPEVIMYNSEALTSEAAPGDWDELLDPKWRGQLVFRYPLKSSTMKTIFSAMIYRYYRQDGKPDRGYEWLRRLDANTRRYADSPATLHQMMTSRQGVVTLWNMPDAILYRQKHNLPLAYKVPRSGTPVLADCIALLKDCPHPEEARLLYEFVTSVPSLLAQAQPPYGRIPAREDVPRERLPGWMRETKIEPLPLDWGLLAKEQESWMEYWDREIRGKGLER